MIEVHFYSRKYDDCIKEMLVPVVPRKGEYMFINWDQTLYVVMDVVYSYRDDGCTVRVELDIVG